jgi:hypothetical protein
MSGFERLLHFTTGDLTLLRLFAGSAVEARDGDVFAASPSGWIRFTSLSLLEIQPPIRAHVTFVSSSVWWMSQRSTKKVS